MIRACPRDRSPLHEQRAGRVNVDVCPTCHGTFLDGIELRRVVGDAEIALALADKRGPTPAPLPCPACGQAMFLDAVDGIQLDHCAYCLGIWLDVGEQERLAARSLEAIARARTPKLDGTRSRSEGQAEPQFGTILHDVAIGLLHAHDGDARR